MRDAPHNASRLPRLGLRWLAFARYANWGRELRLRFVAGDTKVEAGFRLEYGRHWDLGAVGTLCGTAYEWRAETRREVDGVKRTACPVFSGTFTQSNGTSGTFNVRDKNGELLTLGVLGGPHSIVGTVTDSNSVDCPVEVTGLPGLEIRLEHSEMYAPTAVNETDIRAAGERREYAGFCVDHSGAVGAEPPAIAVFTALVLTDVLLIRRHYLTGSNS